jgi:large subunit ribosomal protein L6
MRHFKRHPLQFRILPLHINGPCGVCTPVFISMIKDTNRHGAGTMRAHLQNYILGVSEGHVCILSLVGVGFRASIESTATTVSPEYPGQKFVSLKAGYSHPIELGIPQGVSASTPQPTRILLEGIDKEVVTRFAAEIRQWRRPEPYKGKGIFVNGETIKLKSRKIK